MKVLVVAVLLTSCGLSRFPTAESFKIYTADWNQLTGRSASTPVRWGDIRPKADIILGRPGSTSTVAICTYVPMGGRMHDKNIIINADRWLELKSYCHRLSVIVHELVHCELEQKEHDSTSFYGLEDGSMVENIMSPTLSPGPCDEDGLRQQVIERWSIKEEGW